VRICFFNQAGGFEIGENLLARLESIETVVLRARQFDLGVDGKDVDLR